MKISSLVVTALLCLFSLPAFAADEGLYDPAPPAGSAFIRVINSGSQDARFDVRGKAYSAVKPGEVGAYVPVKKGEADIKLGKVTQKPDLVEGGFYTVIASGDNASVLKDQDILNETKAMISFYNLTGRDNLSLKTADGKVEVIAPVANDHSAYREINAVKVKLAVYDGDKNVLDMEPLALRRREPTSVVLTADKTGKLAAQILQAKTDSTQ